MPTTWTLTPVAAAHMRRNGYSMFDLVGLLLDMLNEADPASAREQLDAAYAHGGGWNSFKGFSYAPGPNSLRYPGDPPLRAIAETRLRDERIILFESSWVAIIQPNGDFEVSRMD